MDKYWIWFSRINKIGIKAQKGLLEKYKTPQKIWNLSKEKLFKNNNLSKEQIDIILDNEFRNNLELYEQYMVKNNIRMINIHDKDYPRKLINTFDAPVVLYVLGNEKNLDNLSIAIIGSRECSEYGRNIAKEIAYSLSKHNINIISGLARGIDSAAHWGTLQAKKQTIAVVGTGLDIVYPEENKKLANYIVENGGTIISEYIIGTKPEKMNFPARNRIISALCDGVLVVEAKERSGTFITVDFVLEQGKNVYAVPREY